MPSDRKPSPALQGLVANNLRSLRVAAGLTQEELGLRAGMKAERVSKVETNTLVPTLKTLEGLAQGLGCPVAQLLSSPSEADEPSLEEALLLQLFRQMGDQRRRVLLELSRELADHAE